MGMQKGRYRGRVSITGVIGAPAERAEARACAQGRAAPASAGLYRTEYRRTNINNPIKTVMDHS